MYLQIKLAIRNMDLQKMDFVMTICEEYSFHRMTYVYIKRSLKNW